LAEDERLIEHTELIWKAKNDDRASLEILFRIHCPALGRMAYKLAWNRAQAPRMRNGNGVTERPQEGGHPPQPAKTIQVLPLEALAVWLLSSVAAGPLPQLFGGYRTDLFGLWWTAWHFWF